MSTDINIYIKQSVANVFRHAYIRRRSTDTGLYEQNWQDITSYVKDWGQVQTTIDDVRLNKFVHSGITLKVSNNEGKFNIETDPNSLWYGHLTRYNTMLKIEAGYSDAEDTFGSATITSGSEILVNGGFESTISTGWNNYGVMFSASHTAPAAPPAGTYVAQVLKVTTPGIAYLYQEFQTEINEHYRYEGYFYYPGGGTVSTYIYNGSSTLGTRVVTASVTSGYSYFVGSFTADTTASRFYIGRYLNVGAYWLADAISIMKKITITTSEINNRAQGIFLLSDEIPISGEKNEAVLKGKSLISVFQEVQAKDIGGLSGTLTAQAAIEAIRDHTDGSNNWLFKPFITNQAWYIQTTTNNYVFNTDTIEDMNCWELMSKLAESEGNVLLITRTGDFEFRDRDPNTTASMFDFYGLGYKYMSIKSLSDYRETFNKTYNFFRCKFDNEDTTSSYVEFGTVTAVDPLNYPWKYGKRKYEFENTFMDNTTATAVVQNLHQLFSDPKNEIIVTTKFIPHLDVLDRVALYHDSSSKIGQPLWDIADWDVDEWADESGENFNFTGENFKIISKKINLNKMESEFTLREI